VCGDLRVKLIASFPSNSQYSNCIHIMYLPPIDAPLNPTIGNTQQYIGAAVLNVVNKVITNDGQSFKFKDVDAGTSFNAAIAAQFGFPNSATAFPTAISGVGNVNITSEILTPAAPSIELEIPYYHANRCVLSLPRTVSNNPRVYDSTAFDNPYGYLVAIQMGPLNGSAQTKNDVTASLSVFAAGGDTMRFGQFTGLIAPVPKITTMNTTAAKLILGTNFIID
jgi:hypothetical protein